MKIFVICTVRSATEEYKEKLEAYVLKLENQGHEVHLPHRDTNQTGTGFEICTENSNAIAASDEVHVFYNAESQGTHFDMGVAFVLKKVVRFIDRTVLTPEKSFKNMLAEWETLSEKW